MRNSILLVTALILSSCTQAIKYDVKDIVAAPKDELKDVSISLQIVEDRRAKESAHKRWLFSDDFKNRTNCFNIERGYRKLNVAEELEKMMARHLRAKGYFGKVLIGAPDSVDFAVRLKLKSFVGKTDVNQKAQTANAVGSQFGLIGGLVAAAAVSGMSSELSYSIEYIEVDVRDNRKQFDLPRFVFSSIDEANIPAVTHCNQVYMQLNNKLKDHNEVFSTILARKIGRYLSEDSADFELIEEY